MENSNETVTGESNKSYLELVKSWLPILSVVIIFLGFSKEWIYYFCFGIKIQYYITVPELLLIAADELTLILIMIAAFSGMAWIYLNDFKPRSKFVIRQGGKFSRLKFYLSEIVGVSLWTLVMLPLNDYNLLAYFFILSCILYPAIVFEVSIYRKKRNKKLNSKFFHCFAFAMLFSILWIYVTITDIHNTNKGLYIGSKIVTKDSTYISDSTHFYIGKTTNFYFIFNKNIKSATIIPEREVSKFELKKNEIK